MRRLALILLGIPVSVAVGCIGPQGGHREGNYWPTAPEPVPQFNLQGTVRDSATGQPLAGAKVDAGSMSVLTAADGRYDMPGLQATFFQLVTSREGYDTVRTPLMPFNGNLQVNINMRPAPTAIVAP